MIIVAHFMQRDSSCFVQEYNNILIMKRKKKEEEIAKSFLEKKD